VRAIHFLLGFAASVAASPAFGQGYFSTIGYTELQNRLGVANTPNGAGVPVAQVEAPVSPGIYAPNPNNANGRPGFSMTFNGTTTVPSSFSGHANGVAGVFWANGSMGSGITSVEAWDANVWIDSILLGSGTNLPPSTYLPKVSNHSYIAELDPPGTPDGFFQAEAEMTLLRSDYLVDRARHIMVVGAGNNGSTTPSALFGSGYNSIAVGRADGNGGQGITAIAGAGRVKPDLVAPLGSVSSATPAVAAAAALLVQTAGSTPFADRPQTIKAVLMAGARKSDFNSATGGPWSQTTTRPLDPRFGAGMLNINNSHVILTAGRQQASSSAVVASTGWDFNSINTTSGPAERRYYFDVQPSTIPRTFSAVLTWHREFQDGNADQFTFADLNLRLYSSNDNFDLVGTPLQESLSPVDNVEHLWRSSGLAAGRYAMVVEANGSAVTDYAIAWQFVPVPEPGAIGGILFLVVIGYRRLRRARFA
jgi:hypothetical protein